MPWVSIFLHTVRECVCSYLDLHRKIIRSETLAFFDCVSLDRKVEIPVVLVSVFLRGMNFSSRGLLHKKNRFWPMVKTCFPLRGDAGSRTRVREGIELRFLHVYSNLFFEIYQVSELPNISLSYIINFGLVEVDQNYLSITTAWTPLLPRQDSGKRIAFA